MLSILASIFVRIVAGVLTALILAVLMNKSSSTNSAGALCAAY